MATMEFIPWKLLYISLNLFTYVYIYICKDGDGDLLLRSYKDAISPFSLSFKRNTNERPYRCCFITLLQKPTFKKLKIHCSNPVSPDSANSYNDSPDNLITLIAPIVGLVSSSKPILQFLELFFFFRLISELI